MDRAKRVIVVGGGISGLTTAFEIERLAASEGKLVDVQLYEAGARLGGKIHTESSDGFVFEWGTNGFLDNKPLTFELVDHLGLRDKLQPASPTASKRFILAGGKLHEVSASPLRFFTSSLLPLVGRLRVCLEPFARKRPVNGDETVYDFATRRLGRAAAQRLIDPMVAGVFAGKPQQMSLKASFPRIYELERDYGGLVKAMIKLSKEKKKQGISAKGAGPAGPGGLLTSFQGGLRTLIDALGQSLGDRVHLEQKVTRVARDDGAEAPLAVAIAGDADPIPADAVVLAAPAFVSAGIAKSLSDEAAKKLTQIPYPPVAVVGLGFKRDEVAHPLDGFGFIVPTVEGRDILGTLFTSSFFEGRAPEGHVLLRTMIGGARQPELCEQSDEELVALVHKELSGLLGFESEASFHFVARHERAIPQYTPGHLERLDEIEAALHEAGEVYLVGNAYRGIGMNDCIVQARDTAQKVLSRMV